MKAFILSLMALAFLFIMGMLVAVAAKADCTDGVTVNQKEETRDVNTDVPKGAEGGTVVVLSKDGKELLRKPIDKMKVVPRKQQFVVTKVEKDTVRTCTAEVVKAEALKNRLSLLGGRAPLGGLSGSRSGSTESVESKYGTAIGAQYQRDTGIKVFGLPLNAGGQVQNNKAQFQNTGVFGTVGVDF